MATSAHAGVEHPTTGFRTTWQYIPSGARRKYGARWLFQRATKFVLWFYMRAFHRFEICYDPRMPSGKPYIAVMSHTSFLDVPALMVADPFDPPTHMIIKEEMIRVPVLGWILRQWDAISVQRRGQDIAALRRMKRAFQEGRGICIAPSGTRSADGRLGPVSPVLARLILQSDVPVFPAVIVGSMECLRKGSWFLRPGKIYLATGAEIDLSDLRGLRLSQDELLEGARRIRDAIADLLPDHMKPLPSTPVLGTYVAV